MKYLWVLILFSFSASILAQARAPRKVVSVETQPQYTKWQKNYSISKISFYEKRIVLDLEFVFERGTKEWTKSVIFMPPNTANSWCLKDSKSGKIIDLLEITSVTRNGVEIKARLKSSRDKVQIELPLEGIPKEIFTCQVHFPNLPNNVRTVDLLEGYSNKYTKGHWNFFDIQLKPTLAKKSNPQTTTIEIQEEAVEVEEQKINLLPKNASPLFKTRPSLLAIENIECNKILELREIVFQDNSTKFQSLVKAERALSILRTYLQQYPNSTIELYGHTDIYGTPKRNLDLSQQRVNKLKDWFIQKKIHSSRIKNHALGDSQPLFPEGNAKNRRVEVKIICTAPSNQK
ncbi:MAG: OmpA family protein [Aureispira sp.]|nr:OmpA family protein [Aureispira sp.]